MLVNLSPGFSACDFFSEFLLVSSLIRLSMLNMAINNHLGGTLNGSPWQWPMFKTLGFRCFFKYLTKYSFIFRGMIHFWISKIQFYLLCNQNGSLVTKYCTSYRKKDWLGLVFVVYFNQWIHAMRRSSKAARLASWGRINIFSRVWCWWTSLLGIVRLDKVSMSPVSPVFHTEVTATLFGNKNGYKQDSRLKYQ